MLLADKRAAACLFADVDKGQWLPLVTDAKKNTIQAGTRTRVRVQLLKMMDFGAIIMKEFQPPPTYDKLSATTPAKSTPTPKRACIPNTPRNSPGYNKTDLTPSSQTRASLRSVPRKLFDGLSPSTKSSPSNKASPHCRPNVITNSISDSWFEDFASVLVVEHYFQNEEMYIPIASMPDNLASEAMRKILRNMWRATSLPVPDAKESAIAMKDKRNCNVFNVERVINLVRKLSDKHSNFKQRERMKQLSLTYRRRYYNNLPVQFQPLEFDATGLYKHTVMAANCLRKKPSPVKPNTRSRDQKNTDSPRLVQKRTPGQVARDIIADRFRGFVHISNGKRTLTDQCAVALQMISAECGVSDINLGMVISYVCVYLLGVPPPAECLFDMSNVIPKWRRIHLAETKLAAEEFVAYFEGHPRAKFYLYTDDTGNKHATYVAYPSIGSDGERVIKRLLLSVSAPLGGTDVANAELNLQHLKDAGFPLARFNGGCTDHKARGEIKLTFDLAMREAGVNIDANIHLWYGDYFHKVSKVSEYVSNTLCPEKKISEGSHKQLAYALRSVWLRGTKYNDKRITSGTHSPHTYTHAHARTHTRAHAP